jgi:Leucine-rich repeat (LRR) protein
MMDASSNSYSSFPNGNDKSTDSTVVHDLESQVPVAAAPANEPGIHETESLQEEQHPGVKSADSTSHDLVDHPEKIQFCNTNIKNKRTFAAILLLAAILFVVLLLVFLLRKNRQVDQEYIMAMLPDYTIVALNNTQSAQSEAMRWLLADPHLNEYPDQRLLQRLTMAIFYHALGGNYLWTRKDGWLNYTHHECDWITFSSLVVDATSNNTANHEDPLLLEALGGRGTSIKPCPLIHDKSSGVYSLGPFERLELNGNHLAGSLPAEVAFLTSLKTLILDENYITGSLPSQLGLLSNLEILSLRQNQLTGPLPLMARPNHLRTLLLSDNEFTGNLYPALDNQTHLEHVVLDRNQLGNQTLPSEFSSLLQLQWLSLASNRFHGPLPEEWGTLSNLKRLDLSQNLHLNGTLPIGWESLRSIKQMNLGENSLIGPIPHQWGYGMTRMESLQLSNNRLHGHVPGALEEWTFLRELVADQNMLSGPLPSLIGYWTDLQLLQLQSNSLTGSLPTEIGRLLQEYRFQSVDWICVAFRCPVFISLPALFMM